MICELCKNEYKDLFDTTLRLDYTEPGKGKPYEFHLCLICRKKILKWIKDEVNR